MPNKHNRSLSYGLSMSPLVRLNWVSLSVVGTFSKPWVVQLSFVLATIMCIPLFILENDGNTFAKLFTTDGIKMRLWILSVVLNLYLIFSLCLELPAVQFGQSWHNFLFNKGDWDETMVLANPSLVSCAQQTSFDARLKPASGSRADPTARPVIW